MGESLEDKLYCGKFEDRQCDAHGRLCIPIEFRKVMIARSGESERVWVVLAVRNGKPYLACYDSASFLSYKKNFLGADAWRKGLDKQGRLILQEELSNFAHIKRGGKVVLAASPDMKNFEIWNPDYFKTSYKPKD